MQDQNGVSNSQSVSMPEIIYGTAWKKERTERLVVTAVLAGFRGIDTACQPKHYDEAAVGEALRSLQTLGVDRESLFLQTKFTPLSGHDPLQIPYDQNAPLETQVAQSFEVSKRNLQTDYVDSLLLHSPLSSTHDLLKVWQALEEIHEVGGARQLGISNCYDIDCLKQLFDDVSVKPAVLQNRFYQKTGYDASIRSWCFEQGMIYQSFWTLTANTHILESPVVRSLAEKYAKTVEQIFFRFISQIGIVPLTGTTSEQHMKEDLDSFDIELTDEELESVGRLLI